jgi:hypothetical protein
MRTRLPTCRSMGLGPMVRGMGLRVVSELHMILPHVWEKRQEANPLTRTMMHTMGRDRTQQQVTPDLFSTASPLGEPSPPATSAQERRHVLPKDLAKAVKHLTDRELDLLITACVEEAKRRGRSPPSVESDESVPKRSSRTDHRRPVEAATVSLPLGQINAVRAAFKAGVKPSLIARQFGLSQSDVRKVLASDTANRSR